MLDDLVLLSRGAVIGITSIVFLLLFLRPESRRKSLPVGFLCFSLAGHMAMPSVCGGAMSWQACGLWIVPAALMPVAITWFVMVIFLEGQVHRLICMGLVALSFLVTALILMDGRGELCVAAAVVLYLCILALSVQSACGDLVESRRVFRPAFVAAVAVFGVVRAVADLYFRPETTPVAVDLAFSLVILGFALVFAVWALLTGRDVWAEARPKPVQGRDAVSPADRLTLHRIEQAMTDELWRREGLTIGEMATEINVPEHRLRKAINHDLGYRNFSAFVNGYRIDAAKAALIAPENAQRTILEIAYDCGFASLAPFNRAFRDATGTNPRAFRRNAV